VIAGVEKVIGQKLPAKESPRRPGDALEVPGPEIPEFEQIAEQPSRAVGNDDRVRLGQRLQTRRQVRRVADDRLLLGGTAADQIADHDKPGRNADTHLQGRAGYGRELRHRLNQRKPGKHGAFGVMLVGLGIAEIGQHTVPHVLGDETAGSGDEIGAAAVVRADDLPHVLGVEASRERGRADEVTEHDRELTALGGVQRARRGRCRSRNGDGRWALLNGFEIGNRAQQLAAMAQ